MWTEAPRGEICILTGFSGWVGERVKEAAEAGKPSTGRDCRGAVAGEEGGLCTCPFLWVGQGKE